MGSHAYGGGSLLGTQVGGGVRLTVLAGSALRVGCVGALRLVRAGGSSDGAVVELLGEEEDEVTTTSGAVGKKTR